VTATTYTLDKSGWGEGPWQNEPDRVDFVHAGFACLALRGACHGAWCAYVGVPSDHPAYGKNYDDVDVGVHGGLTYAGKCREPICHVPEPGMPDDVWWFGFDCAHAWDLAPGHEALARPFRIAHPPPDGMPEDVYRDLPFVRQQIESLAEQLRAMAS
jgi:hypothetical protein